MARPKSRRLRVHDWVYYWTVPSGSQIPRRVTAQVTATTPSGRYVTVRQLDSPDGVDVRSIPVSRLHPIES